MLLAQAGDPLLAPGVHWAELLVIVVRVLVAFGVLLVSVMLMIWFERKLISDMQDRIGPNRAGPFGILQTLADGIKLFFKEDLLPERADSFVFKLAPYLSIVPALVAFTIVPVGGIVTIAHHTFELQVADPPIGILLLLAMSSISVYGVMLAGWSSGSKYPLLGSVRASAQMISYEAALGLTIVTTDHRDRHGRDDRVAVHESDRRKPGPPLLELERHPSRRRTVRCLPDCHNRRAQPPTFRSCRSRAGAGGRLPHGVLVDPFRPVLHGGIHEHDHDVCDRRDSLLRRTRRPGPTRHDPALAVSDRVVRRQDVRLPLPLCMAPGCAPAPQVRPADGSRMEVPHPGVARMAALRRRSGDLRCRLALLGDRRRRDRSRGTARSGSSCRAWQRRRDQRARRRSARAGPRSGTEEERR